MHTHHQCYCAINKTDWYKKTQECETVYTQMRKQIAAQQAEIEAYEENYNGLREFANAQDAEIERLREALTKLAEYHGTTSEVWANSMKTIAREALEGK
jgi:septal ring factor EnvC (AmiA/AmiB activator)